MPLSGSILTRLRHQHEALPELIRDLSEEELKQRTDPGKWSAFENIAHLAAYQPAFIDRLKKIIAGPTPVFQRYVAEKDPEFPNYLHMPLETLLHLIPAKAAQITACLTGLKQWQFPPLDAWKSAILAALG